MAAATVLSGAAGSLTKFGAGSLTLSGANTYSGGTTVSNGTLVVSGQILPNSGTGTNTVTVNAGGTLSGNGRIGGAVTVANSATAVLYPNTNGTLTLGGNLTFGDTNSVVEFNLSSTTNGANDKVVFDGGSKTLACGGARITINSAGVLSTNDYVLFDVGASGAISSNFNTTPVWSGTTPQYSSGYSITNGTRYVTLHYTPVQLTVTAAFSSKTYDGNLSATGMPTVIGLQGTDNGTFSESYADKNVGINNKTLNATLVGAITNGSNDVTARYNINYAPCYTGTILAKALTITANNDTKIYGQTRTYGSGATAFTTNGLQNGETIGSVTLTASGSPAGDTAAAGVGSYTITPSLATGGTCNTNNYTITYNPGTLTVNKATPTSVSATGGIFANDGHPHAGKGMAIGGAGETLPVTLRYIGTSYDSTNAPSAEGIYTVTASTDGDANNESAGPSDPALLTIRPLVASDLAKITAVTPTNATNVSLQFGVEPGCVVTIYASDNPTGATHEVGAVTNADSWTEFGAITNSPMRRFYTLVVTNASGNFTNTEEWALYVQPRVSNRWVMTGMPIDFESAGENNLTNTLGTQLIRGLKQGDQNNGDLVYLLGPTNFLKYWSPTGTLWYAQGCGDAGTNAVFTATTGFWVQKKATSPSSNAVYTGRARTNLTYTANITTNWNFLAWPCKTDRKESDAAQGAASGTNNFGWGFLQSGGIGSTIATNADTILLVQGNSWKRYYLLSNGRWWDYLKGGYADFTMQTGQGFYYYRRGTTGFTWTNGYGP